jgi:two-component system response regulator MtrA
MTVPLRKSIVVVNDSQSSLQLVADALERDGYAVVPCADVARAHAVVRASMPDLVMLDSRGAGPTSWRAPAMLKLDAQTAAIPVLLCLADAPDHAGLTARAGESGCSILLAPFEPDDLLARVRDLVG